MEPITRRAFLGGIGIGSMSLCLPKRLFGGEGAGTGRDNVLFIMSGDHAAQAISAYEGIFAEVAPTPNINRIAKER